VTINNKRIVPRRFTNQATHDSNDIGSGCMARARHPWHGTFEDLIRASFAGSSASNPALE